MPETMVSFLAATGYVTVSDGTYKLTKMREA